MNYFNGAIPREKEGEWGGGVEGSGYGSIIGLSLSRTPWISLCLVLSLPLIRWKDKPREIQMEASSRIVRRNLREPFKIHRSLWIAGAISQQNEHLLRSTNTFRRLMHHADRSKLLVLHAASVMRLQEAFSTLRTEDTFRTLWARSWPRQIYSVIFLRKRRITLDYDIERGKDIIVRLFCFYVRALVVVTLFLAASNSFASFEIWRIFLVFSFSSKLVQQEQLSEQYAS